MVRTIQQAARYIDQVGFCLLFPSKGLRLPSLFTLMKEGWAAVKGSRSFGTPRDFDLVASWDKDTERLWEWKDELPRRRLAYYGKYFRGKGSLISLAFLPCFYRLEGNYGSTLAHHPARPERSRRERQSRDGVADEPDSGEYETLYREGRITADACALCQELFARGPQATLELRYALGWTTKAGNRRFQRALAELQRRLLIVHWGVAAETRAWESVVYQLTSRAFPRAMKAAAKLSPDEARQRIAAQYRKLNPAATAADFKRLFGWK